ncbi:MAG: hypothetical protein RIR27_1076, partial [Pseudomonadota bacterium]
AAPSKEGQECSGKESSCKKIREG